jgi:hypothetical protein
MKKKKIELTNQLIIDSDLYYLQLKLEDKQKVDKAFGSVSFDKYDKILLKYAYIIFLLEINKILFEKLIGQQIESIPLLPQENLFELLIEKSDSNFGHVNIVCKGDVVFPDRKINGNNSNYHNNSISDGSNNSYNGNNSIFAGGNNSYNGNNSISVGSINSNNNDDQTEYFNKQEYLKDKKIGYSDEYFKLYRYNIISNNLDKINKQNYRNGPTLSLSLFMDNEQLFKNNYSTWTNKYFSNQIRIILVFKYYFPDSNIRVYLDWYMLEAFKKLTGDDPSLILI